MHPVVVPESGIAEFVEAPEVDERHAEVVGDAAQQFVVDRRPPAQPAEHGFGPQIRCGEGEDGGAGLLQGLQAVGVAGHHGVHVDAQGHQVVHPGVDGHQVWFGEHGGLDLVGQDVVHGPAAHSEVGVAELGIGSRQPRGQPVGPAAHAVRAAGVGIADAFGEGITQRDVSAVGHHALHCPG